MNHFEERLTAALRELAASSRQAASLELGSALTDAVWRHHNRQRRIRRARIAAIAICLAALAALPLLKRSDTTGHVDQPVVRSIPPEEVTAPPDLSISQAKPLVTTRRTSSNARKPLTMAQF